MTRLLRRSALVALTATMLSAGPASGAFSPKKAIFGPLAASATQSMFPTYKSLGVGIYETKLRWDFVAPLKPKVATDPGDRRYEWPDELEFAVSAARANRMQVAVTVLGVPSWANGNRGFAHAPDDPEALAAFLTAAARRYPGLRLWRIGDDVNTAPLFQPLTPESGQRLSPIQQRAPRRYAVLLDRAYGALKAVNKANIVIGGNTASYGDIAPRNWIKWMVLPDGRPPRMDLYGHSPYGGRVPAFGGLPPVGGGHADFADTPLLAGWVDRYLARPRHVAPMQLFLAKWFVPSNPNAQFEFFVSREEQAAYIHQAFVNVRASKRIYALGWEVWQDPPPNAANNQPDGGLIDAAGEPKPAFAAYRDS